MLTLAIDHQTNVITGYYHAYVGFDDPSEGRRFDCTFYFRGMAEGKQPFQISAWYPSDYPRDSAISGTIAFSSTAKTSNATIHLDEDPENCWNVENFTNDSGSLQELTTVGSWISIRLVSAKRAYFFSAPTSTKPTKRYVTSGDPVRVFQQKEGRVEAEFVSNTGVRTRGWLQKVDLRPDPASQTSVAMAPNTSFKVTRRSVTQFAVANWAPARPAPQLDR